MRKRTILWLILSAFVLFIIGIAVFVPSIVAAANQCTQAQVNAGTCHVTLTGGEGVGVAIGAFLWVIAAVLWFIAWIGALVRSARMQSWGWFVVVLLLSGLGTLLYAIVGPPDRPSLVPTYPQGYPPQGYPPQGYPPPGYPPQGNPPQGYPPQNYPPPNYPQPDQGRGSNQPPYPQT